jgi:cobyrinic acid a,c-diamide synthase
MRAIAIAGTHSGCGKTTVTLGLIAAFRKKGMRVQPFKIGPDFIDAGLHRLIANRPSRNLDLWMCGEKATVDCFQGNSVDADIAVIEGVMGMYDGHASTASLAHFLQVPVILVVDAYGMAESAGAVVKGYTEFGLPSIKSFEGRLHAECGLKFAGVIFNRVSSEAHFTMLKNSVTDVTVLGYLPRELGFEIPNRHLGLVVAEEQPLAAQAIDKLADAILEHIDLDLILEKAACGVAEPSCARIQSDATEDPNRFTLAVAYDKAFCFYYEDNLDAFRNVGAEIIRFSPLSDTAIPSNADMVYIGGGYPEIHAAELSRNTTMLESIRDWSNAGKPLYAECGGLMYLSHGIHDMNGSFFPMADAFSFETRMTRRPTLGYREIVLNEDCVLGKVGETCRGHEFHFSEITEKIPGSLYTVRDQSGKTIGQEGFMQKNTVASYIHLHFSSNRQIAGTVAAFIKRDNKEQQWQKQ